MTIPAMTCTSCWSRVGSGFRVRFSVFGFRLRPGMTRSAMAYTSLLVPGRGVAGAWGGIYESSFEEGLTWIINGSKGGRCYVRVRPTVFSEILIQVSQVDKYTR